MGEAKVSASIAAQTQAMAQAYWAELDAFDQAFMSARHAEGMRGRDACNAAISAMMRVYARHCWALEAMGAVSAEQTERALLEGVRANMAIISKSVRESAN